MINQFLMTTFLILQLWHEEGAVALLRHSSASTGLSTLSDLVSVSLSLSLVLSLIHSLFHLFAIEPAQFKCICSVSVEVEIIHANQEQWLSMLGSQDSAWGGHSFTAAPPIIFFPLLQNCCMYTVTERTQFTASAAWLYLQLFFFK